MTDNEILLIKKNNHQTRLLWLSFIQTGGGRRQIEMPSRNFLVILIQFVTTKKLKYFLPKTRNFRPPVIVLAGEKVALFSPQPKGS